MRPGMGLGVMGIKLARVRKKRENRRVYGMREQSSSE